MPARIFCIYTSADQEHYETLASHLSLLEEEGLIAPHRQIGLEQADIILMLISADFLASDSCTAEMAHAVQRHEAGTARVIPVIVRSVILLDAPIAKLWMLPVGMPVCMWEDQTAAWDHVIQRIRRVITGQRQPYDFALRTRSMLRRAWHSPTVWRCLRLVRKAWQVAIEMIAMHRLRSRQFTIVAPRPPGSRPVHLSLVYAPQDRDLAWELGRHLFMLRRQGQIDGWMPDGITTRVSDALQIQRHVSQAEVFVLLLSADLLASRGPMGQVMRRALDLHQSGAATIVPVRLYPLDLSGTPLAGLQILPQGDRAVVVGDEDDLDQAGEDDLDQAGVEVVRALSHFLTGKGAGGMGRDQEGRGSPQ